MDLKITKINEYEFIQSNAIEILGIDDFSRVFGFFVLDGVKYKLSWNSCLVDPYFLKLKNHFYCIGIDQKFVIFNTKDSQVKLKLSLEEFFISALFNGGNIFVATELKIIVIDIDSYSVVKIIELPDVFQKFIEEDSILYASLNDKYKVKIKA